MAFELFARSDTGSPLAVTTIVVPDGEIPVTPVDLLLWNRREDLNVEELRSLVETTQVILTLNGRDLEPTDALFALEGQGLFSYGDRQTQADLMKLALYVSNSARTRIPSQLPLAFFVDAFHDFSYVDLGSCINATPLSDSNSVLLGTFTVVEDFEDLALTGWTYTNPSICSLYSYTTTPYEGSRNCYHRSTPAALGEICRYDMGSAQDWQSAQQISWWHRNIVNPANTCDYRLRIEDTSGNTVLSVEEFDTGVFLVNEWHNVTKNLKDPGDFAPETGTINWAQIRYLEIEVTTAGPGSYNYNSYDYITVVGTAIGNRLQSTAIAMEETPSEILVRALGTIATGIDLFVSRDGGTTFTAGNFGEWIQVSGQPSGSSLVIRMDTTDTADHNCEGWAAVWR